MALNLIQRVLKTNLVAGAAVTGNAIVKLSYAIDSGINRGVLRRTYSFSETSCSAMYVLGF